MVERTGVGVGGPGRSTSLRVWKAWWLRLCSVRKRSAGLSKRRLWNAQRNSGALLTHRRDQTKYLQQVQQGSADDSQVAPLQGLWVVYSWELGEKSTRHMRYTPVLIVSHIGKMKPYHDTGTSESRLCFCLLKLFCFEWAWFVQKKKWLSA